ncbi:hypothetical protein [Paenibacillus sp. SN-8-1]
MRMEPALSSAPLLEATRPRPGIPGRGLVVAAAAAGRAAAAPCA